MQRFPSYVFYLLSIEHHKYYCQKAIVWLFLSVIFNLRTSVTCRDSLGHIYVIFSQLSTINIIVRGMFYYVSSHIFLKAIIKVLVLLGNLYVYNVSKNPKTIKYC